MEKGSREGPEIQWIHCELGFGQDSLLLSQYVPTFTGVIIVTFFLKILFICFREMGREGEKRGRETPMCKRYINWLPLACPQLGTWPATQAHAQANRACDVLVCRPALNPLSHSNQDYSGISDALILMSAQTLNPI